MHDALLTDALGQGRAAFARGDWAAALDWLESVPADRRPKDLCAKAHAAAAKDAIALGRWGTAEDHLQKSLTFGKDPLVEKRLGLIRRHTPLLDDARWALFRSKVDPAQKLPYQKLAPELRGVYTCGAYHAWSHRDLPWSVFLRIAKDAPPDTEDGAAALRLAGQFLCRVVFEETPILRHVDVVIAIPANPARYERRMMSLPDDLGRALQDHFGLPFLLDAVVSQASDNLELRGLSWSERRQAIRGSMRAADLGLGRGRTVLLVDDVTTSGATLRECARILRAAGVADVYAVTLSHTEG